MSRPLDWHADEGGDGRRFVSTGFRFVALNERAASHLEATWSGAGLSGTRRPSAAAQSGGFVGDGRVRADCRRPLRSRCAVAGCIPSGGDRGVRLVPLAGDPVQVMYARAVGWWCSSAGGSFC